MTVVRLSALRHRPPLPAENIPVIYFFWGLSQTQFHSAAGGIKSKKIFDDTIGNRTREVSAFSAEPQPTAPPAACTSCKIILLKYEIGYLK